MENYPKAVITYTRAAVDTPNDQRINAILSTVCNSTTVSALRFNGFEYIPNFGEPLCLGKDIYFHLLPQPEQAPSTKPTSTYNIEPITFNLYTENGTIESIHEFVKELVERYEHEKKNRLGNEIYYFDMIVEEQKRGIPQKTVAFRKSRFHTNRRLEHVYFAECAHLRRRLDFFMNHKEWYDRKGIPHTLGIVMYGEPGCGKTSTIKAIANETKRHIFNVMLSEIKTKEALKNLFFNDVLSVHDGEIMQTLNIPVRNRIYIIEDIDRMNSVVLKDVAQDPFAAAEQRKLEEFLPGLKKDEHDKLDLATLLNVLDGVRETPGRIIILSTNHPERLDEALLRPGRFDLLIHFKKHNCTVLKEHVRDFYDEPLADVETELLSNPLLENKWTPAEVSQVLFKYIDSKAEAIDALINAEPRELFSFRADV
jgi:chaperone BCS1